MCASTVWTRFHDSKGCPTLPSALPSPPLVSLPSPKPTPPTPSRRSLPPFGEFYHQQCSVRAAKLGCIPRELKYGFQRKPVEGVGRRAVEHLTEGPRETEEEEVEERGWVMTLVSVYGRLLCFGCDESSTWRLEARWEGSGGGGWVRSGTQSSTSTGMLEERRVCVVVFHNRVQPSH